uniref:Uncharacterized protein n=1 Tax=Arion vulgaris TaxID=1028688 RepID=A0A0B7AWV8_9EUPU
MKSFGTDVDNWENVAQDRSAWRTLLQHGSYACEAGRTAQMEQKRQNRKAVKLPTSATILCPHCTRTSLWNSVKYFLLLSIKLIDRFP